MSSSVQARVLRVLARPAFRNKAHNPYNAMLYSHLQRFDGIQVEEHEFRVRALRCDVLHLHWPEHDFLFYGGLRQSLRVWRNWLWLVLARILGIRIVWTAHNEFPHDAGTNYFNPMMWRSCLRMTTHVAYMSRSSERRLKSLYPFLRDKPSQIVRHGDYADAPAFVSEQSDELPIPLRMALATGNGIVVFGQIKPYKNVERLIEVFRQLADEDIRLCIVGKVSPAEYAAKIAAEALTDWRIILHDERVEDRLLSQIVSKARLVVLPYKRILNSGSVLLALGMGTPVLAPSVDTIEELGSDVGPGWIRTYAGELQLEDLASALHSEKPLRLPDLSLFRWSSVAAALAQFYRRAS